MTEEQSQQEQSKVCGDAKFHPNCGPHLIPRDVLAKMVSLKKHKSLWVAFQNHDTGHKDIGVTIFLSIGEDSMNHTIPSCAPDGKGWGLGWRYKPVGYVDLKAGKITQEKPEL
jgi:hypothetical protein